MAIITNQTELGYLMPSVSKQMSIDMFKSDIKTIHNDQEAAEREGLPAPIAVGPQVAALIFRMMSMCFGKGWYEGGSASLTFRRPVFCSDFITAKGIVKEKKLEDGGKVRVVCEVWIENQKGVKNVVGTCSGVVEA